jgi:hypothetical protein
MMEGGLSRRMRIPGFMTSRPRGQPYKKFGFDWLGGRSQYGIGVWDRLLS